MTLLAPLSAIVAGALGLLALLVFYSLKLRCRPVRVSSTMLWDDAVRDLEANVPFRWLRPSWLLLLQLLILALLALALGRPVIEGARMDGRWLILVLDRSASMRAVDEPEWPSRLERAREELLETARVALRRSSPPTITLIESTDRARILTRGATSLGQLRVALDGLEPTDTPGDLAPAIELVEGMAQGAAPTDDETQAPPVPDAIFFTDGVSAPASTTLAGVAGGFRLISDPAEPPANLGIVTLAASRDPESPASVRLFARVASSEPRPIAAVVTIEALSSSGWDPIERAPLRRTGDSPDATASAELWLPRGATLRLSLPSPGERDALASDDRAWIIVPPPPAPRVLLVAPDAAPDPLLADVLAELGFGSLTVVSPEDPVVAIPDRALAYDLIVLDRVPFPEAPARPSLSFGVVPPGLIPGVTTSGGPASALTWSRLHPATRDISLDTLRVADTVTLGSTPEGVRITPIVRGERAPLMVESTALGVTRLGVLFALEDSNWPVEISFPLFVAAAIDHLLGAGAQGVPPAARAGELVSARPSEPRGTVTGPTTLEWTAQPGVAEVEIGPFPLAGLYNAPGLTPSAFAASVLDDPTTKLAPESVPAFVGSDPTADGGTTAGRRELTTWFVLAALVMLTLEWAVSARRSAGR